MESRSRVRPSISKRENRPVLLPRPRLKTQRTVGMVRSHALGYAEERLSLPVPRRSWANSCRLADLSPRDRRMLGQLRVHCLDGMPAAGSLRPCALRTSLRRILAAARRHGANHDDEYSAALVGGLKLATTSMTSAAVATKLRWRSPASSNSPSSNSFTGRVTDQNSPTSRKTIGLK